MRRGGIPLGDVKKSAEKKQVSFSGCEKDSPFYITTAVAMSGGKTKRLLSEQEAEGGEKERNEKGIGEKGAS